MNPVEEFLELQKQANWLGNLGRGLAGGFSGAAGSPDQSSIGRMMGQAGQGVAVSALVAGTGMAAAKGIGAIRERFGKARDFRAMVEANPALQKEDAGHVQMLYSSLRRLSPTMAKDPILAGSFVRESLRMGPEGQPSVRFDTAKMLSETERNVNQAGKGHPLLDAIGRNMRPMMEPSKPQLMGTRRWETGRDLQSGIPGPMELVGKTENIYGP